MNALSKIQAELKAPKNQENKFGGYKYRSCEDILEAVKPLLAKHEACMTITDSIVEVGGRVYVKATVKFQASDGTAHEVDGFAREAETKKGMDEAQITGAASSYARKYALNGMYCIDDTKDADATNDHGKAQQRSNGPNQAKNLATRQEIDAFIRTLESLCRDKDLDIDGWLKSNSGGKIALKDLKDGKISTHGLGVLTGALEERKAQ
jgi:hypothetical protein